MSKTPTHALDEEKRFKPGVTEILVGQFSNRDESKTPHSSIMASKHDASKKLTERGSGEEESQSHLDLIHSE